ncbi:MAG: acyl carrier protein [Thermoguttaceae bacterium]|nr:acyl carrier protein [Thermoguttaceae bacterium]MBQ2038613.1 acyl carrier protein [Thermoguttaceae bacterium]MBQ4080004.1 acyl carrier protein [Thermoguttaceae bacterium]MBQ4204225.1 acyl carrier protein [Thermoguttaceae bacterium]MBQ5366187.1 acyl carrier protein [Thermoguttaceae bacterium]
MATKEEIFATVAEVLVDSLAVDEEEVTREATLVDDLGAESIDLLEIVFNLEKKFDVKIDRSELIPEDLFTNPEYVVEGKLTPAGLAVLEERLPNANLDAFKANPLVQNISKILTVEDLCNVVEQKLA